VFGADTLAWTALKAGRVQEAQAAIQSALSLGTRDARMLYHAGMIARAAGDQKKAARLLKEALALNPRFDLLQARLARQALGQKPGDMDNGNRSSR
jgi:tetratricopeptide (TPR) repeat protein